jgi:hypothetical protein
MRIRIPALTVLVLLLCVRAAAASGAIHRFALVAGVNFGGGGRTPLLYAVSDAERFAQVLREMGGVEASDCLLLREPSLRAFQRALEDLRGKVAAFQGDSGRVEVLLYYSGHADEEGLLLGTERLSYRGLRDAMDAVQGDVHIAVLDACASGAITRIKGGQRQKAFLVDASSEARGYAFLTSSSANEAAQESDRLKASFFTHSLISGMRGGADVSGDGRVTLGEAYQFAFHETLARTAETQGGAQHPAYDINLSGTGDVVMTDIRQTSAGLVLSEGLNGRFLIRNASQQLVAELFKPAGRKVELGLEPGEYDIRFEQRPGLFAASVRLAEGQRLTLGQGHFQPATRERTTLRGEGEASGDARANGLAGRHRIEVRVGAWRPTGVEERSASFQASSVRTENILGGGSYAYGVQENLSAMVTFSALVAEATDLNVQSIVSILFGVRYYLPRSTFGTALRPYLTAGVGPYIGNEVESSGVKTLGTLGGHVGGGLDILLGRRFMLGAEVGYDPVMDFSEPVGSRRNYSGLEFSVGLSFLFGKGVRTPP